MNPKELENPEEWASQTFASAELGDLRRTDRLVQIAAALAEEPAASLPNAMRNVSETMAAYRFLNTPEISHEQIMQPHWAQTRQMAAERAWVLLIADQTEITLTSRQQRHSCPQFFSVVFRSAWRTPACRSSYRMFMYLLSLVYII